MDIDTREAIRSNLHHIDLLLRKLDRKVIDIIKQGYQVEAMIIQIEELKKPIYRLLDKEEGG